MDADDGGFDRHSIDDGAYEADTGYQADSVIHADITWRGPEAAQVKRPLAPFPARRSKGAGVADDRPIEDVIVGSSPQACALRDEVKTLARNRAPVLIVGETGVGKELVARELHRWSDRCSKPFIPLNAGAIPETLASTELFGHTKGAYTGAHAEKEGAFEAADGGVLFLDEIGDTPLSIQAQLLRVLDDGVVTRVGGRAGVPVDFRLVAATNVDLRKGVAEGSFRRDLFHRIDVLVINVPPLRARGDDVIEIGEAIIHSMPEPEYRNAVITPKAASRLGAYQWPGNVRELANVLTRAVVRADGGKIMPEHLTFSECDAMAPGAGLNLDIASAKELVANFLALKALKITDGNATQAAKLTGRSRGTMQEVKRQFGGDDFESEYETICNQLRMLLGDC